LSDPSGENTDFVLSEIFCAMDVPMKARDAAKLRPWAGQFPYVYGGLFGNKGAEPRAENPSFRPVDARAEDDVLLAKNSRSFSSEQRF
jgi:hypothetical protein